MKTGIIIAVIVVILGGGAIALTRNKKPANSTTSSSSTTQTTPATDNTQAQSTANSTDTSSQATITYSNDGFSPATLTVKAGTTVTIKNTSSQLLQFDSNPHPTHTDDPELNVGTVSPGQSKTFTVTKTGSHGYHNHLNTSDTGTLIVN